MERVLISGGNGLIGRYLSRKLTDRGYKVAILSRNVKPVNQLNSYFWNPEKNEIDKEAVATADFIIHLAGVNLGERRWTKNRKQEIINSRVNTAQLLFDAVKASAHTIKAYVSASAIGYYGSVTSDHVFIESDPPSDDFLGETCRRWEASAKGFESRGIRTVIIRTGVVLSSRGGVLEKITPLLRSGLGSPLGNGRQYFPWIHIDDLCEIYIRALEDNSMTGAFNAVAPDVPTNRKFYKTLATMIKKPMWLPPVPAFLLKMVLGEMAEMLLEGSRVSSGKIMDSGYRFIFPELKGALADLLKKKEDS